MSDVQSPEKTPYAASIREAIVAGDLPRMKSLVPEVERFISDHGNVSASLELLKIEIARFEAVGGGVVPASRGGQAKPAAPASLRPYGCAIRHAVASGELTRMKAAASLATEWLSSNGDIGAALQALKFEIAKLESSRA